MIISLLGLRCFVIRTQMCWMTDLLFISFFAISNVLAAEDSGSLPPATPEAVSEVQRLTNLWKEWRERTKSLKVEGWRFTGVCTKVTSAVTRDELRTRILDRIAHLLETNEVAPRSLDRDSLEELTTEFFPVSYDELKRTGRSGTGWKRFVFIDGSSGRRVDYQGDNDKKVMIRKDGKEQEYDSRLRQASLRPAETALHMEKLEDFLHTPGLGPTANQRLEQGSRGRRILTNGGSHGEFLVEYEPATGLVYRDSRRLGTGAYLLERTQEYPVITADEIPFARMIVLVAYNTDDPVQSLVRHVDFYLVDSVSTNVSVVDEDFQVSVPEGTTVVDFGTEIAASDKKKPGRHPARRVSGPVEDVVAEATNPGFFPSPPRPFVPAKLDGAERQWGVIVMLAVNVVALVFVVAWWYRARRRRAE